MAILNRAAPPVARQPVPHNSRKLTRHSDCLTGQMKRTDEVAHLSGEFDWAESPIRPAIQQGRTNES